MISRRLPILAITIVFACMGCSSFFWRDATGEHNAVWIGGDEFVDVHIQYEERNSLDPLAGTTLKRNYRTQLQRLRVRGTDVERIGTALVTEHAVVPSSVYALGEGFLFLAEWESGNVHRAFFVDAIGTTRLAALSGDRFEEGGPVHILFALPSPDGSRVVFVGVHNRRNGVPDQSDLLIQFYGFESAAFSMLAPPVSVRGHRNSPPAWSRDGGGVFVRDQNRVHRLKPGAQSGLADRFPGCFHVGTTPGGFVSVDGTRLYFDPDFDRYTVQRTPGWVPFERVSEIDDPAAIGRDCP